MQIHINCKTRRPNRWPSSGTLLKVSSLSLILSLLLIGGSEALFKQQQRSDDSQQQQQQQQANNIGQTQSQQQSSQHHQSAYQNHQSQQQQLGSSAGAAQNSVSQASPSSYSSSVSISSSSPNGQQNSQSSPSVSSSGVGGSSSSLSQQVSASAQQAARGMGPDMLSGYSSNYGGLSSSSSSGGNQKQQSSLSYSDLSGASSANAPDQSYQAAANSVNLALANSGIFGSTSSGSSYSPSSPSSSQSSGLSSSASTSSSSGQSGVQSGVQSLNPLHYFYYPSKEAGSTGGGAQAKASGVDMMSNSASNNYQSMAYPTYADQLSSAISSIGPDAAASSQDPSYLPQPSSNSMGADLGQQAGSLYNGGGQQQGSQQQQQQQQGVGQQANTVHPSYNGANGDLSAYSSINQATGQQSPNGISFNGPTSGSGSGQASSDLFGSLGQHSNNQHQQQHQHQQQQQQQQIPPMGTYQSSNLFNQMGDLSTSNFGNNAGGLSSVASYMAPNQQHQAGSSQHDLFANSAASLLGAGSGPQQFSSAASSLTPASISPSAGLVNQQQVASGSLFSSGPSGLYGQQSQPSQANANNLFSNQHYLSSFFQPQQYSQLAGQQQSSQMGALDQSLSAAATSPAATSVAASGSSKRFGIGSFIMPMLALAGLSLLIPTMSNIGTAVGRKKRSIGDKASSSSRQQEISFDTMNGVGQLAKEMSIGEYMDKIERYYSIYKNAVENDDCLNRLICEFGGAVKDVTGKTAVVTVIEKLAPTWMTGKVHLFKEAALDNKEGKEKCKKYVCHSNKRH